MITKHKAIEVLADYKENEDLNLHAENYLLLAETFEDENAIQKARFAISTNTPSSTKYSKILAARNIAHAACNHYYYKLVKLTK